MHKKSSVFISVVLGLVWLSFYTGFCPAAEEEFARAVVKKPNADAGTVVEGTDIRHTFLLQNRGNAPLVISRAETDCSCTEILHDDVVLPGRNSYLRSVFHTRGRSGEQVNTIRLFSNDPRHPELLLTVRAEVLPSVTVEPDRVFFNGAPGRQMNQSVVVRAPKGYALELSLKQRRLSDQTGVALERNEKENFYTVFFRHKGESSETFLGRVLLSTNIPHQPVIPIPVYVRLLPDISVFPGNIDFGRLKLSHYRGGKRLPDPLASVSLKSRDGGVPEITSLDLNTERFEAKIDHRPQVSATRITVRAIMDKFEIGAYQGKLEVQPAGQEPVTVPIHLELR